MTLRIKFVNDITFKYIHDLIMEVQPMSIEFIEEYNDIDLNYMFHIAHLLNTYLPEMGLKYISPLRDEYPINELSPEFAFRDIPFEEVIIGDKYYNLVDERI